MRMDRVARAWFAAGWLVASMSGCDLNKLAADGAAGLTIEASSKMEGFWDAEIALRGMPSAIMQLEAMHYLSPQNEGLRIELAKSYIGYAYGRVEVDFELQEAEGELDKADVYRARARRMYRRARDLCLGALRGRDAGIDQAIKEGPEAVAAWAAQHFTDPGDLAPLFWAAMAWGSMINMSADDPGTVADLPIAKAMAERVAALNPGYAHAGALVFLGGVECGFPELLGGSIKRGSELFERALSLTGRRAHSVQLNYARQCALNARDRDLYVKLLREIIEAPDQGNDVRLQNKFARARAERYLAHVDDAF